MGKNKKQLLMFYILTSFYECIDNNFEKNPNCAYHTFI